MILDVYPGSGFFPSLIWILDPGINEALNRIPGPQYWQKLKKYLTCHLAPKFCTQFVHR
jgi:hypothetical protein